MPLCRVSNDGIRRGKIGMIKGIENIRAELDLVALRQAKGFGKRRIELLLSIGVQRIDSGSSIRQWRPVDYKSERIKPLLYRWMVQLAIPNAVCPISLTIVQRGSVARGHIKASATAHVQETGIFPTAKECIHETIRAAEEAPAATNGKLRAELGVENVRDVLLRRAVVLIDVCLVKIVAVSEIAAVGVTRVDGYGLLDVRGEPNRESVVPTAGDGFGDGNIAQLWIPSVQRTRGAVVRAWGRRWSLVDVCGVVVIPATNAKVANVEIHPGTDLPLDVQ